jgi:hypothetical protein
MLPTNNVYDSFTRSSCYPSRCSCEPFSDSLILQPLSVVTSLPALFLGFYILFKMQNTLMKFFGYSVIILAFGSIIIHGSYLRIGEFFDFLGLLLVMIWFLSYALFARDKQKFIQLFVGLHLVACFLLYFFIQYKYHFIGLVLIFTFVALFKHKHLLLLHNSLKTFFLSMFLFAIGFMLFMLDLNHLICDLPLIIQGHVLWHILSFVAKFFLFKIVFSHLEHKQFLKG